MSQQFPVDTVLRGCDLPSIRAGVYVQDGKPDAAIDVLDRDAPHLPKISDPCGPGLAYVRGQAYLKAGRAQQAATQFRKVIEYLGMDANSIIHPLTRL